MPIFLAPRSPVEPEPAAGYAADLVSVVMPAYNAERWLERAIGSVRAQSWTRWEAWVVDDGSCDRTAELAERQAAGDARIHLLRLSANRGPAEARNAALARARGRFVAFLDSDDFWLPRKLERQLAFMRGGDAAFSFTAFRRVSEDGTREGRLIPVPARVSYRGLLGGNVITASTVMIDRARTGPFSMAEAPHEDFALWLSFLRRGFTAAGLAEDLARYTLVRGSRSRRKLDSAYRVWKTFRQVEQLSLGDSLSCFARYASSGLRKHRRL